MRAFQDAQTVQDYLVHLDEIEDEAREFFTTDPGSRKKISRFSKPPNFQANDTRLYFQFLAIMESGDTRSICLYPDPKGPKIDFHAYSRHCSHS
jgi:hypothetical protein